MAASPSTSISTARGLMAAVGTYMMSPDQLDRYRSAVADDSSGQALETIIADLEAHRVQTHDMGCRP